MAHGRCSSFVIQIDHMWIPTQQVVVRGKENDAEVTKMPFVPNTYYRKGK